MRGVRAKQIRRAVFGDHSIRFRQYGWDRNQSGPTSGVRANARRRQYQAMKRIVGALPWTQRHQVVDISRPHLGFKGQAVP